MVITQCFNHQFGQQLLQTQGSPDSHGYFWKVQRLVGACFLVPLAHGPQVSPAASRAGGIGVPAKVATEGWGVV